MDNTAMSRRIETLAPELQGMQELIRMLWAAWQDRRRRIDRIISETRSDGKIKEGYNNHCVVLFCICSIVYERIIAWSMDGICVGPACKSTRTAPRSVRLELRLPKERNLQHFSEGANLSSNDHCAHIRFGRLIVCAVSLQYYKSHGREIVESCSRSCIALLLHIRSRPRPAFPRCHANPNLTYRCISYPDLKQEDMFQTLFPRDDDYPLSPPPVWFQAAISVSDFNYSCS